MCNKWFARSLFLIYICILCSGTCVFYRYAHAKKSSPEWNDSQCFINGHGVLMYVCHSIELYYFIIMQLPNQFRVHHILQIDHRLLMISELLLVKIYDICTYVYKFLLLKCSCSAASAR